MHWRFTAKRRCDQRHFRDTSLMRQPSGELRGRVLFDQQLSRRPGIHLPVELRYDEYEVNIVENRVSRQHLESSNDTFLIPALARRLAHLRFRLDGVEPWPAGMNVPMFNFTRLNQRYRAALALARLILERRSLEFPDQTQRGSAFLFNMNHIFEKYVDAELRRELEGSGGRVDGQRKSYLDEARHRADEARRDVVVGR